MPIRLLDMSYMNIYISSNYDTTTRSIELTVLVDNQLSKRRLTIDRSLGIVTSILLAWMSPQIVLYANCDYADTASFSMLSETSALSMLNANNLALSSVDSHFYKSVRDGLIGSGCVTSDFVFPSRTTTESISSINTSISSTTSSSSALWTLTTASNYNSRNIDADFLLLVYNVRISQYRNLQRLGKLGSDMRTLNARIVNLTRLRC
jgi:hypothetical protein